MDKDGEGVGVREGRWTPVSPGPSVERTRASDDRSGSRILDQSPYARVLLATGQIERVPDSSRQRLVRVRPHVVDVVVVPHGNAVRFAPRDPTETQLLDPRVLVYAIHLDAKARLLKLPVAPRGQIERGRLQRPHAHLRRRHLSPAGLPQELRVEKELDRFRPELGADFCLGDAAIFHLRPTSQRLERLQRVLTLLGGRVDGHRLLRRRLRVGLG